MEAQKPVIGEGVHFYHPEYGGPLAATVTKVHKDGTADLFVMGPTANIDYLRERNVPQARMALTVVGPMPDKRPSWNWMPRVA